MNKLNLKKLFILFIHIITGWFCCGVIMVLGRIFTTETITLIIHIAAVPVIFSVLTFIYYKYFKFTVPLLTAFIFTATIILIDFFILALLIKRDLSMFKNLWSVWLPFTLIFISTYLTGLFFSKK